MSQENNNIYDKLFQQAITMKAERGDVISSYHFFLEQQFSKNKTILEVGCNTGSFLNIINTTGFTNIYGVDISERAIHYGKQKYPDLADRLMVADGNWLPFKAHSVDIIASFDTLEHIPHVDKHMAEILRILKSKDGIYILQTPNKYINVPWEVIQSKSLTKWKHYHCSLQTHSSLISLLSRSGFKDIKILKRDVLSDFNRKKVRKKFGTSGLVALKILNFMPKQLVSNFWVIART